MLAQILAQMGFQIETNKDSGHRLDYLHIDNRDGSMRWIWPADAKNPLFLKFYSPTTTKARIFELMIKIVFRLQLQRWIFGRKSISVKNIHVGLHRLSDTGWALFTGTPGPNRKAVMYNQNGFFEKISLGENARHIMENEAINLTTLSDLKPAFEIPAVYHRTSTQLVLSDISSGKAFRTSQLTRQHTEALSCLSNFKTGQTTTSKLLAQAKIPELVEQFKSSQRLPYGLVTKMAALQKSLAETNQPIRTSFAHGDFTPWNVMHKDDQLAIYDWELAAEGMPMGFDLFHYVIQSEIMLEQSSWQKISERLEKEVKPWFHQEHPHIASHFGEYLKLYLIKQISYYLNVYEKQAEWHPQIYWQINLWNQALSTFLTESYTPRQLLILDIFDFLYHQNYAISKMNVDTPEQISEWSDIDLVLDPALAKKLIRFISRHPFTRRSSVQKTSYMRSLMIHLMDDSVLSLDLIRKIKVRHLFVANYPDLIRHPVIDGNKIKRLDPSWEARVIGLFYHLNGASIPDRYLQKGLDLKSRSGQFDALIYQTFKTNDPADSALVQQQSKSKENQGIRTMLNRLQYAFDSLGSLVRNHGEIITISGVDGAGKSTIIDHLSHSLHKKFRRKIIVLRHRPSLLPILSVWTKGREKAKEDVLKSLPRQGQNQNPLSSGLRFLYYYADYFFGQWFVYIKYLMRGYTVIYDRYYFDFINDGRRSNLSMPRWVTKLGYVLLLKPRYNFFLYADPEVILKRKQELDRETISGLTQDYLHLFGDLRKKGRQVYLPIENVNIDNTLNIIHKNIIH
ncbi:MAG: phosphotransferase [Saprospiraceae bacterium]|nr:phosphotransferase [Saprospiraceae bacterium]